MLGRWAEHQIRVLTEGHVVALSVDLRRGRQKHQLLLLVGVFEHDLRAVDVRLDGVDRLFDDQSDTDSRGEMKDDVRVIDQLRQQRLVVHGFNVITEP